MISSYFSVSFKLMRAKPVRAALSLAGIYIGTLSLLIILAVHRGMHRDFEELYRLNQVETFQITPSFDANPLGGLRLETVQDLRALPGVHSLTLRLASTQSVQVHQDSWKVEMLGVDPDFLSVYRVPVSAGRMFLPEEARRRIPVCLLTRAAQQKIFPHHSALGQFVLSEGIRWEVIGVVDWTANLTQRAFLNEDPEMIVPEDLLFHTLPVPLLSMVEVRVKKHSVSPQTMSHLQTVLTQGKPERAKLYVITPFAELVRESRKSVQRMLYNLLSIAAVSLLVGGIGIANVMLISVIERTREIGLRKALGAEPKDILTQFLVEASVLTGSAGLFAIVTGGLLAAFLPVVFPASPPLAITGLPLVISFLTSFGLGLLSGAYPASHAAHLSPAEALRYE